MRILLVDDHAVLREGLRFLLERQGDLQVVGEAGNGLEALELVQMLQPDLVVIDLAMPHMNGLEATRKIKTLAPGVRVLVLTQHDNPEYILPLIQAGASGYVLKRSGGREVITAIRQIIKHGAYLEASITQQLIAGITHSQQDEKPAAEGLIAPDLIPADGSKTIVSLAADERPAVESGNLPHLTGREKQVLHLVILGRSNKEIGRQLDISPKTVSVHRSNIMLKLGVNNAVELVHFVEKHPSFGLLADSNFRMTGETK